MAPDRQLSDLMRRAQRGDARAYEALLREVMALVRAFARSRLHRDDGVEDVAQETLLAIHRDRHTWDPGRPFLPWMYAIARNRLLDLAGKRRRQWGSEIGGDRAFDDAAVPATADREPANRFLRRALAMLSSRQRDIIQMLKFDGLSVADISLVTGMSQSSNGTVLVGRPGNQVPVRGWIEAGSEGKHGEEENELGHLCPPGGSFRRTSTDLSGVPRRCS